MMKLYLAARYSRKDEILADSKRFKEAGHIVTSTWIYETQFSLDVSIKDQTESFIKTCAHVDLLEVECADGLVFYSEDCDSAWVRGGRHVEFGYALGKGKLIFVVGPKENTFHYYDGIEHFPSVDKLLERLREVVDAT